MDYNKAINAFENYIQNYDLNDHKIKLKHKHTYQVAEISELLATSLNLSEEDIELAKLIGLLHDIGRFEQAKRFDNFKDKDFDHALYGVKILFEDNLIRDFITSNKHDEIIYNAVKHHNKMSIPNNLDERTLMFCKIIRDADKIDIFRVMSTEYEKNLIEDIKDEIIDYFESERQVDYNLIDNKSEKIILDFALVYDINYKQSFKILNDKNYLEDFISCINVSEDNREIFEKIVNKVRKVMEENLC